MTTGGYDIGNLNTYGFHLAKSWSGTDGRYISAVGPRRIKWNTYQMTHRIEQILGAALVANNWCTARSVPILGGAPVFSNLTSNYNTWLNNAQIPIWNNTQGAARFNSYWTSRDETKLLSKLLYKFKGSSSFNVGVSLAEVDKFANSTVNLIKSVGLGAVDLLSGRYSNFARRFGASPPRPGQVRKLSVMDVPAKFLAMQYCWLPAYNDLFAAAEAFEEISKGPRRKIFEAGRMLHAEEVDTSTWLFPRREIEAYRRYTVEMYEELSAYRQIGLGNPASIVWERIPWSFVVDWFIPVGTYLELIGQVPFMKGRYMRSSSFRQTCNGALMGRLNPSYVSTFSGPVHVTNFWYYRELLASLSVPRPTFAVSGAVQGKRVNNAIALATQLLNRVVDLDNLTLRKSRRKGVDVTSDYKLVEWSKSILLI